MKPSGLPVQSVPFNIVAVSMLILLRMKLHKVESAIQPEQINLNNTFGSTNITFDEVQWNKVSL